MRVKVTRTVGLEEVPAIVEEIISECKKSLKKNEYGIAAEMHDVPSMIRSLEDTIENLSLVSIKLQDVINIAIGWHEALKPGDPIKTTTQGGADEQL